jgi:very-short-patch-repair endonuclease
MRKKGFTDHPDALVARLAQRDHGVVTTSELLACGLTYGRIHRRARTGRLHRLHQGVYAVGHAAVSQAGRWLAAVKACGAGALLSHQSAGLLWGFLTRYAGPIHITVPIVRSPSPTRDVSVHRSRTLKERDITCRDRIPVTTPRRTLQDLKRVLPREEWEAAVDRARNKGYDITGLVDEAPTRSVLERRFLRLCRRHRIPAPRVNVRVGDYLVDFLWPERRLIVEVDGYEFHRGRESFESDRARDAQLIAHGYRVLRFTYRQVTQESAQTAATLRRLLH